MKLVQVKASTPSSLDESLEDNVQADLVPESEAVCNRASNAINAHTLTLDLVFLDSELEQRR